MRVRYQPYQPSVLIVESDSGIAERLSQGLQSCCGTGQLCLYVRMQAPICSVVASIRELHEADLNEFNLILCGVDLSDGSGIDALAYVRGVAPSIPFALTAAHADVSLAVEAIRAGAIDYLVMEGNYLDLLPLMIEKCLAHQRVRHERDHLHHALNQSLGELCDQNTQLESIIDQLEMMARTDELTGLSNRRWLNETLRREWAEALRNDQPLAALMIDLDEFKTLNDTKGHQRGDELLQATARVLDANCRDVDLAARWGGDEFCVLMPNTELAQAVSVALRILREFRLAATALHDDDAPVGLSIGVAHIHESNPSCGDQLIQHADEAMYALKGKGGSSVMVRRIDGITLPSSHEMPDEARPTVQCAEHAALRSAGAAT